VFDEAIEGTTQRHQAGYLGGMRIGDGAGQDAMLDLAPMLDAALLEPGVQSRQIGEAGQWLPEPSARILNVLLDLPLLPTGSRVAELRLEQIPDRLAIKTSPTASANGSSLLGRSGTLNFGSTVPARRYLRIVLRDKPVRRSISRIGILSRKCQRRITLNNAMSFRGKIARWTDSPLARTAACPKAAALHCPSAILSPEPPAA
jgi:hypothetical protein